MSESEWARGKGRPFVEPHPYKEKMPSSVVGGSKSEFPNKLTPPRKTPATIFTQPRLPFLK